MSALEAARRELGLTVHALWLAYFALGGLMDARELEAYLLAVEPMGRSDADHDAIVHALNEAYDDAGSTSARLPYRAA